MTILKLGWLSLALVAGLVTTGCSSTQQVRTDSESNKQPTGQNQPPVTVEEAAKKAAIEKLTEEILSGVGSSQPTKQPVQNLPVIQPLGPNKALDDMVSDMNSRRDQERQRTEEASKASLRRTLLNSCLSTADSPFQSDERIRLMKRQECYLKYP